jgi:hypothetical protein
VAAAMGNIHRMPRRRRIKVLSGQRAALRDLRVVILEAEDPLACWSAGSAIADRVADRGNGAEVAIDPAEMKLAGGGGVSVGVDEAGNDGPALEVDLRRARAGQIANLVVVADSEEAPVRDRDGAGPGAEWVDRDDISPVEDQVRHRLKRGEQGYRSHALKKSAPRGWWHRLSSLISVKVRKHVASVRPKAWARQVVITRYRPERNGRTIGRSILRNLSALVSLIFHGSMISPRPEMRRWQEPPATMPSGSMPTT